ncbi:C13 family peptidase [Methylobacillus arboreus]|uniref:C13 family peptidase n=1 Tax=Methylobacillus arboreus TaxID=755170 RepID=UPI001E51BB3A|nr:C13 family peptidase [Methylobacillus arboreus]MCB5191316.1 C13 family peptidase [Methylobacillus arboreus]
MSHAHTSLRTFFIRGLQSAFFQRISVSNLRITPLQLLLMLAITTAASILMGRLVIIGPAEFFPKALLWGWLVVLLLLWLCWYLSDHARERGLPVQAAALFAIGTGQAFALDVLSTLIYIVLIQPQGLDGSIWHWGLYIGVTMWAALAFWLLLTRATQVRGRLILLAGIFAFGAPLIVHFAQAPMYWLPQEEESASLEDSLQLSQEKLETQLQLAGKQRAALKPERPGVVDLFSISYAPYGDDEVFLRESSMVNAVIEERFDAAGHMQELVNHPATVESLPWASLENLERAINRAADLMNTEEDVLLVYLTSHGAQNGELSATLWPLEMNMLTPQTLNLWLDKAGIKHRVIVVSACYSGSWIAPLQNDNTLIMTAADATHTSFGCGSGSDLTFFGRAVFDEALRETYSFEEAFQRAAPVIREREEKAGKPDGFSNPQIYVGEKIRPVLQALQHGR